MDRSDDKSRQVSRMIRQELPKLSIEEDEPSRYDSRAPQASRVSHGGDRRQSRIATASHYESRAPYESRISSMGDHQQSKPASSHHETRAGENSRVSRMDDRQQSRTATYMDPSKPLVIERAPASRHQSRNASSQMTVTNPSHTVGERSRDAEDRRDRRDVDRSYGEEITIRITVKTSYHSSHRRRDQ